MFIVCWTSLVAWCIFHSPWDIFGLIKVSIQYTNLVSLVVALNMQLLDGFLPYFRNDRRYVVVYSLIALYLLQTRWFLLTRINNLFIGADFLQVTCCKFLLVTRYEAYSLEIQIVKFHKVKWRAFSFFNIVCFWKQKNWKLFKLNVLYC